MIQQHEPSGTARDATEGVAAGLRAVPALAELPEPCRKAVQNACRERFFDRGEMVCRQGEAVRSLFFLTSGRVKMIRTLEIGREVVLALFGPGEVFGTACALGGRRADASLVVVERCRCLVLDRDRLFELFARSPSMIAALIPVLVRPLCECRNCIVEHACSRVETRIAGVMLRLARGIGQPRSAGVWIPLYLSRQDLADMTGTTIETAIRVMSRWGKSGLVETRPTGFFLRDPQALAMRVGLHSDPGACSV